MREVVNTGRPVVEREGGRERRRARGLEIPLCPAYFESLLLPFPFSFFMVPQVNILIQFIWALPLCDVHADTEECVTDSNLSRRLVSHSVKVSLFLRFYKHFWLIMNCTKHWSVMLNCVGCSWLLRAVC